MDDNIIYSIRQLAHSDVAAYKTIRLEALQLEPGMFGNSYALESSYDDQHWATRVTADNAAIFGLHCGEELIGITGIISTTEKPEDAYMTQSYIRKPHRGKGLSRMLYEARIAWAKEKNIKQLIIGHRASNTISRSANQRFGFSYTHAESRTWPDGNTEDMVYYELIL